MTTSNDWKKEGTHSMEPASAAVAARFPKIAEYAFLSDHEVNALVAPSSNVEWMCLPRPDSASVFGAMLDRSAGFFRFGPPHIAVPSQRRYVPGTMALETTWNTGSGWLVVTDALVLEPWKGGHRPEAWVRPPGDYSAAGVFLRTATCVEGNSELQFNCLPLFEWGTENVAWNYDGEGYDIARCISPHGEPTLELASSIRIVLEGSRVVGRTRLHEGETAYVALSWGPNGPPTTPEAASDALAQTMEASRSWLSDAKFPDHPWTPYLERSALTLKGLSYAPTGAVMAAATTSLPETPHGERNWDYRYTWIRDSAFMLRAMFRLGFDWEAYQYAAFLRDALATGDLQIMYGIGGERELTEHTLDHLSGYEGARPVRIGNGAYNQKQHDVWGMLVDAIHVQMAQGNLLAPTEWQLISTLVDDAIAAAPEPDRGIWEVRGEPKHFVSSKVMCWIAADRGRRLAADRGDTENATKWKKAADELQAEICEKGVDKRGVFVAYYGASSLDASVLLIPLMGFLPPDDERVKATVLAIADELTKDGLVLRYQVEHTDDGLEGEEGTFTICSFWLVSALAMIGEVDRARHLCEKLLALASPLHLYAEELDAVSGRHLGNFPQAFTHLSLIDAVLRLIEIDIA